MTQVVIRTKNLSATVANLISSNTVGYSDLSQVEATKKLAERISEVLQLRIESHGEERTFYPDNFWHIWKGTYCTFSPVSDAYGAIENLPSVEVKGCDFVMANLYTSLG